MLPLITHRGPSTLRVSALIFPYYRFLLRNQDLIEIGSHEYVLIDHVQKSNLSYPLLTDIAKHANALHVASYTYVATHGLNFQYFSGLARFWI